MPSCARAPGGLLANVYKALGRTLERATGMTRCRSGVHTVLTPTSDPAGFAAVSHVTAAVRKAKICGHWEPPGQRAHGQLAELAYAVLLVAGFLVLPLMSGCSSSGQARQSARRSSARGDLRCGRPCSRDDGASGGDVPSGRLEDGEWSAALTTRVHASAGAFEARMESGEGGVRILSIHLQPRRLPRRRITAKHAAAGLMARCPGWTTAALVLVHLHSGGARPGPGAVARHPPGLAGDHLDPCAGPVRRAWGHPAGPPCLPVVSRR